MNLSPKWSLTDPFVSDIIIHLHSNSVRCCQSSFSSLEDNLLLRCDQDTFQPSNCCFVLDRKPQMTVAGAGKVDGGTREALPLVQQPTVAAFSGFSNRAGLSLHSAYSCTIGLLWSTSNICISPQYINLQCKYICKTNCCHICRKVPNCHPQMRRTQPQNSCMQQGPSYSADNAKKDKTSCLP